MSLIVKLFMRYDTVKITAVVLIFIAILVGMFIYRTQKKKALGLIGVLMPVSCLVLFICTYMTIVEITNSFTIGVLDNTAAVEAELKFRRTISNCNLAIKSESGDSYYSDKDDDKGFTIAVDNSRIGITKYVADLTANEEDSNRSLSEIIDIADAEFKQYEYDYFKYKKIEILSGDNEEDLPTVEITVETDEELNDILDVIVTGETGNE